MTGLIREKCETPECKNDQASSNNNYLGQTGVRYYRQWCWRCHDARTAALHGKTHIIEITAERKGYDSVADFKNSKHPYRKFRKKFCENKDKRLGYKCKYKIRHSSQLQVDHIDGNPANNKRKNLQTLCANCHLFKTHKHKDYLSAGRKKLKIKS